jgi:hypothetical protein
MNPTDLLVSRLKRSRFAFLLLLLLVGCVHSETKLAGSPPKWGNSHPAYLRPEPHRQLYVEMDAVEGAEFSDSELRELESVLRQWTRKPEGVEIVRSSSIPRSAARGHSADSLARRYLDGPPTAANNSQPAYFYILVYDNRVHRRPVQSPRAESLWLTRDDGAPKLGALENPHVVQFPYPAMIYADRSWPGGLLPRKYWNRTLIHETGHVLGLVNRESQVENHHCETNWCVMNAHVSENIKSDFLIWLKRGKSMPLLCEACAAELRQNQTSTNTVSTRFIGPVLVRTMPSYHVLALPAFSGLYIGDSVDTETTEFIKRFRKLQGERGPWFAMNVQESVKRESLLQAIAAAKLDIDPTVRWAANELEHEVLRTDGHAE